MLLQRIGDSIWTHEQAIRFGAIPLRHCMTVIGLAQGGLVVHSPTHLNDELSDQVRALGPVVAVIAPSWWHDLYLRRWLRAFPEASLYGAPTLVKWRRSLAFTDTLTNSAPPLWKRDLEQHQVEGIGAFLDEIVFYHRASRSLVLADLLFNLDENDAPITKTLAPVVIGAFPGCRFPYLYRPLVLNGRRFRDSIERILDWDFERIIVGHGSVVEREGKEVFLSAFRWLLK